MNPSKNYKLNNLNDVQQPISTADPLLLFVFLFHSASMAEKDISPGLEIVENLDASGAIDGNEGRLTTPTDLAQAIVADREFIAKISSAIWANIAPNLNLSNEADSNPNACAVPEGQAEELNPGVSVDQTGISESSAIVNPVVTVDQSGAEKRTLVPSIDSEMPAKRPRTCLAPEPDGLENANNDSIDDELISPNSRWEASEELTEFLGTSAKRLSRFERRSLVKFYPRPNVDSVYTPALDEYLKPFIQGVSAPDKPLKELQDNILDIFGPLSTVYENLIATLHTIGSDAFIQLDKESISTFLTCVKHTMLLVGDVSSRVATNQRELVLKKINPLLLSLANEDFTDANKQLFGPGFEQRLKARSETAETIGKAAKVGKPFFRGMASRGFPSQRLGRLSSHSARLLLDQTCSAGKEEPEARSQDFKTHVFTIHRHSGSTDSKAFQTKQFAARYVYKFSSSFKQADRLSSNRTPKVFYFNMGKKLLRTPQSYKWYRDIKSSL